MIDELLSEQAALLHQALDAVMARQRRIRSLLEAGLDLEGEGGDRIQALPVGTGDDGALYALSDSARRELMAIHPGSQFSPEILDQSLRRAEANLNSGVRLQVVHQTGALGHRDVASYLHTLEELGAWVRLRDNVPFRLLLIDREAAVCAAPTGDATEDSFMLRGRRVIGLLERVFETAWVDSTPLRTMLANRQPTLLPAGQGSVGEAARDDDTLARRYARLTPQQQTILRYLAEGETDRMIARRIGVTPRTVTRRVAEIYQELGVEGRFQAGVAAHLLGVV